jgi:predicted nuclease with TOPRIM domain
MRETVYASFDKSLSELLNTNSSHALNSNQSDKVELLEAQLATKEMELQKHQDQLNNLLEKMESMESSADLMRRYLLCNDREHELQMQRKDIENQLSQLELDRKNFTDAAIKMGLERAALQREKAMLVEMQTVSKAPLSSLPSTPM